MMTMGPWMLIWGIVGILLIVFLVVAIMRMLRK